MSLIIVSTRPNNKTYIARSPTWLIVEEMEKNALVCLDQGTP